VARAHVAVVGWYITPSHDYQDDYGPQVLARGRADGEGKFRLLVPRLSSDRFWFATLLAGGPGHALALVRVDLGARHPKADIRLGKEQVLRGRLFDLQGQAVKGVKVEVAWLIQRSSDQNSFGVYFDTPPRGLPVWPQPAVSDDKGRFTLRGIDRDWTVKLHTRDGRFAPQDLYSQAAERKGDRELTWSLAPARTVEGTVTYADTGKPVPRARLLVSTWMGQLVPGAGQFRLHSRTDEKGRFRFVAPVGDAGEIRAYPPAGQPYLIHSQPLKWKDAEVVKKGVRVTLPRGLAVRGTITEKKSGRPVAGATVEFVRFGDDNPFANAPGRSPTVISSAKGKFELAVVPGPGHLLIKAPTQDYLRTETTNRQLYGRNIYPNRRLFPNGLVALNLKPKSGPHEVTVTLRRGVTVRGTVVGPGGKPVARAKLVSPIYIPHGFDLGKHTTSQEVRDGRFELRGCDPDRAVPAFFLDAKNRLGAMVELSGKQADQSVTVKLRPCGTAKVRFVDAQGKPFTAVYPNVGVVLNPGVSVLARSEKKMADVNYPDWQEVRPDAQGRITFATLIPGATYRLSGIGLSRFYFDIQKDFKAESGKTVDLGDVVVKKQQGK
jgi:protocatechuate 3,4-dioxygenase beta subunit